MNEKEISEYLKIIDELEKKEFGDYMTSALFSKMMKD